MTKHITLGEPTQKLQRENTNGQGSDKDSAEEATIWVGGLDKIHEQRGILKCFDLSATPFTPSGKKVWRGCLIHMDCI